MQRVLELIDLTRLSHGLKTALACLIGFSITELFSFEIDQWLIITIIIVMCAQLNVGGMLQKAYMRFFGTLAGSIIAIITIVFFHDNEFSAMIAITLSVMIFSYIATGESSFAEAGTLGAATVVIILINPHPSIRIALERFFEINIGILIAALVAGFVFPIHARHHLRVLQAKTLRQLREFYLVNQICGKGVENFEEYQKLEEDIASLLIKQRKLSQEAARELSNEEFKKIQFQQLLRAERGILRSVTIMHYICEHYPAIHDVFKKSKYSQRFSR